MRQPRFQATWIHAKDKPAIYHCISYVVNREHVLGAEEKEKFREWMRIYEQFTGCRVLTYVLMNDHLHLILEVPPVPKNGISDEELLRRVAVLYGQEHAEALQVELETARQVPDWKKSDNQTGCPACCQTNDQTNSQCATVSPSANHVGNESSAINSASQAPLCNEATGRNGAEKRIHERFTYRMYSLSEFMKGLMQRYTQWHNRRHERRGHLWEARFKSAIVEDGKPARTLAAYINLNPVRSGYVKQPEDYRWSSYGEAVGGGWMENGRTAQAGLARVWGAREELSEDALLELWKSKVAPAFRRMMVEVDEETTEQDKQAKEKIAVKANDLIASEVMYEENQTAEAPENTLKIMTESTAVQESGDETGQEVKTIGGLPIARVLRLRIRYFTDGVVIGTKAFLEEAFQAARERFGANRQTGARQFRGNGAALAGEIWSMRDLRKGID